MSQHDEFLKPRFSPDNLDRYIVRSSILKAMKEALPEMKGTLLDVGCGQMPYKPLVLSPESNVEKYIGLDLEGGRHAQCSQPDLLWDGKTIPLEDETIDCAIATEVFEHCPYPKIVMKEIWRVLKPGGILFFTVPFLWNLHETPYDEYRYTPFALQRLLNQSGFSETDIQAMGGWDAALAQMLGLWVRRRLWGGRIKRKLLREMLSWLLIPVIYFLYKHDCTPEEFKEGIMITGLTGVARKLSR